MSGAERGAGQEAQPEAPPECPSVLAWRRNCSRTGRRNGLFRAGRETLQSALACTEAATLALSQRERQVAAIVGSGLSNRAIADRLFISPWTVDSHLNHIFTKLGLSSRTQLALWAAAEGLRTSSA
jgi:DNA-binding CsgD family transcriptional regulator